MKQSYLKGDMKMESIEKKLEKYAIVFNVNLIRATLNEAAEFKDYLAEAVKDSAKDIIVNLSACEHLDSTFLGVLVSSYKKLKTQNRTLVIIEPVDQSSIFLTLNSIGKIFPLYTSVKVALEDIENKKLLEKEISELSKDQPIPDGDLEPIPFKFENQTLPNMPEESVHQELKEEKIETETAANDNVQKVPEVVTDEPEVMKGTSWNFVENNVEESISIIEEEPQVVIKQNRLAEETHFGGSGIKWEFGFSS